MATKRDNAVITPSTDKNDYKPHHGRQANQKLKPYLVLQYLMRHTDENNVRCTNDIIAYLEECGIAADRRSIYRDIEEINKAMLVVEDGIDIQKAEELLAEDEAEKTICYDSRRKGFYVQHRHYDFNDIRLLAESVYSAKFLSAGQAERLAGVVCDLVSEPQAETIRHDALLTDRVKTYNKKTLYSLNTINRALSREQKHKPEKIQFKYLEYHIENIDTPRERRSGTWYIVSPYRLLINDGYYYLLGYDEETQKIMTYRVDRMSDVRLMGEPREGKEAAAAIEINKYAQQCFSMFGGETTRVEIRFINHMLDTVIDRFGKTGAQYAKLDEKYFTAMVEVKVSDQFFTWLCSFGRMARIMYPESVQKKFAAYLDKIREMY